MVLSADPGVICIPVGGAGGFLQIPIVPILRDSVSVAGQFQDPMLGDFRWGSRTTSNTLSFCKRRTHHLYCPKGVYLHPETGRKVHIYSIRGIETFIAEHNLYDPVYNANSPFTVESP